MTTTATAAKAADTRDAAPINPADLRRTNDPWVIVAKTARIERFPLGLIKAERLAEDRDKKPQWGGVAIAHLEPGVNFLACMSTLWHYEEMATTTAQVAEPHAADLRAVHLTNREKPLDFLPDFTGERDVVDVATLEAALLRAFRWMADPANEAHGGNGYSYRPDRGHDVPDLSLVRLGDVLGQRGDDPAKMARLSVMVARLCKYNKNLAFLGALHDHAMRFGSMAANITEECRARHRAFQKG